MLKVMSAVRTPIMVKCHSLSVLPLVTEFDEVSVVVSSGSYSEGPWKP